ncbi:response regulator [Spirosoma fluviale]|nr:response regulator [Spirosoma fluviale]
MRNHILFVDDDPFIGFLIQHGLKKKFELTSCTNGLQAIDWFEKGHQPDLIITDLNMPLVTGQALIERIRSSSRGQQIPILVVSANTDNIVRNYCQELGANDFIGKPFSLKELILRINRQLQSTPIA